MVSLKLDALGKWLAVSSVDSTINVYDIDQNGFKAVWTIDVSETD